MICSPYAGAMTKIVWNSMEPFTPFMALEMRFCQIPNGKATEKMMIWPLFFSFFLMVYWKKSVLGTPYSYMVVSARFKVCFMAYLSISVLFLKKDWFSLLKWKWSLSFSLHWAWFVDYMIWLLGQYPWEPISWSNPYPCLIYFILRWLKMCQIPQTLRIHLKCTHYMLNTFNTPKYLNWNYFSVSSESMLDEKIKKKLGSNLFK